jgi:biopolymer transport protein ExbD
MMAFSFSSPGGGRRGRSLGTLADINIIPLVDVVLVLLIIFMLTAHVMEFGLEVDVPKVKQVRETTQELPVVTITKDGALQLNETAVSNMNLLVDEILRRFPGQTAVYVRADKSLMWDTMAQVVSILGEGKNGAPKLAVRLVTQPLEDTPAARR